jgi:hypothetical protein
MKKFLAPAALALALTASGAAFAGEVNENPHLSLYSEASTLTYDNTSASEVAQNRQSADSNAQLASRARMADTHGMSQSQSQDTQDDTEAFIHNAAE